MAYDYTDRRKHQRVDVERAIYIEVVKPGSRSEAHNTVLRCETVDVSVAGLRIWVAEDVPAGSKLNIAVPMEEWKENLELVGKVMWAKPADGQPGHWLGLELEDSSREDMQKWFKVVQFLQHRNQG
ncbi:MAG: PilZ domain-containing protein [Halieaceae bacterium]|nr:PilZ domain-containing protein [Halieaceae bacterium]